MLDTLSRLQSTVGQLPPSTSPEVIMDTLLSEFGATGIRAGAGAAAGLPPPPPDPTAAGAQPTSAAPAATSASATTAAGAVSAGAMDAQSARPEVPEPPADGAEPAASSAPSTTPAPAAPAAPAAGEPPCPAGSSGAAQSAATGAEPEPSSAGGESSAPPAADFSSILGDMEIPEGVDPSFLAALPDDMRQEVVAEQLRLQRIRQRFRQAQTSQQQPTMEVSQVQNNRRLRSAPDNVSVIRLIVHRCHVSASKCNYDSICTSRHQSGWFCIFSLRDTMI